jgi:hypothetical protein
MEIPYKIVIDGNTTDYRIIEYSEPPKDPDYCMICQKSPCDHVQETALARSMLKPNSMLIWCCQDMERNWKQFNFQLRAHNDEVERYVDEPNCLKPGTVNPEERCGLEKGHFGKHIYILNPDATSPTRHVDYIFRYVELIAKIHIGVDYDGEPDYSHMHYRYCPFCGVIFTFKELKKVKIIRNKIHRTFEDTVVVEVPVTQ